LIAYTDLDDELALELSLREDEARHNLIDWVVEALAPYDQTPARHHRLLLSHLEKVARGEIKRLMVLMPPGSAKSTYSSMLFPAWFFAQRPNLDLIGASNTSDLAEDFSGRIQSYIRQHSSTLGYTLQSENVQRWRTTNGGFYRAAGVGGTITGRRADGGLIDDPLRGAADAESETKRQTQWDWYQADFYTRLKPGAWIVLIMTRWHPDDLGGRLLQAANAGGDQWTVLKLPALCDSLSDPLGRPLGAALWPAWQDEEALARIRANVGEYVWGALFQQDPRPRGASFFNIDDLLVDGQPVPMPDRCDTVGAMIDTSIKSGKQHNATAVTYFSYNSLTKPTPTLIIDWDILQIEGAAQAGWLENVYVRLEELSRICGARRGVAGAFIEDKATGTVLIQQAENLRAQGKHAPAYAIDSKLTAMGKDERAIMASPYVIAQGVKITQEAFDKVTVHKGHSANHLISQVSNFRLGSKETDGLDLLDTFCYLVSVTLGSNSGERKGI